MSDTAVCEVGPAAVRRVCRGAGESIRWADPRWAAAALDGGDDPLTLFGDEPVTVETAWRNTLEPLVAGVDDALLIHPSWWPATRIGAVAGAAGQLVGRVVARPRSWLLSRPAFVLPVVEIGPRHVVVTLGDGLPGSVENRTAAPDAVAAAVAQVVLRALPSSPVLVDGPAAVPGAVALAALIGARLRAVGRPVRLVDEHRILSAAADLFTVATGTADKCTDAEETRGRGLLATAVAGLLVAGTLVAVNWPGRQAPASPSTSLVEGRVALRIPTDWRVRRITTGPGSARVQVTSPTDGDAALHITQSLVGGDLAATAATMRQAIDAQAPGLFVDFQPADVRAGRPAVSYREMRPGHEIRWAVLLDGGVRISVGCQSAPGREVVVTAACEQAIGTAHHIE